MRRRIATDGRLLRALAALSLMMAAASPGGEAWGDDAADHLATQQVGDVMIRADAHAFADYESLLEAVTALPEAEVAAPVVITFGLLSVAGETRVEGVEVWAVDDRWPEAAPGYQRALVWTEERLATRDRVAERYAGHAPIDAALAMEPPWQEADAAVAMVSGVGLHQHESSSFDEDRYDVDRSPIRRQTTIALIRSGERGEVSETVSRQVIAVNEFSTGIAAIDRSRVYMPLRTVQEAIFPRQTSRATEIHIRAAEHVTPDELHKAVLRLYEDFAVDRPELPPAESVRVQTRQQRFSGE